MPVWPAPCFRLYLLTTMALFIHPMWDTESQRIGMQKCTPTGYSLRELGEGVGCLGGLLLLGVGAYFFFFVRAFTGTFGTGVVLLLSLAFALGIISEVLVQCSWKLAQRKGFRYDYEAREASWIENGERRTYKSTHCE